MSLKYEHTVQVVKVLDWRRVDTFAVSGDHILAAFSGQVRCRAKRKQPERFEVLCLKSTARIWP